ncbi:transcriptional regulator, GntR family [Aliiroseovarius halocynthiae]|uniref:GntR family transcriptional regulator n=1 Tax=Aliiroseovarius halocynthiae TaxID=985055 RepID=A0A545SLP8_9RHOB|nr:GntR family transcriptional regulator [Aliiroseovarius halocynthiae]TQV65892.1 GntR family transcriptional regulator [Aliiroseovarius halocynthiae]SMR83477.1 transcriptional regulator, GntR family [Aliiroseovarius halocynthiae]
MQLKSVDVSKTASATTIIFDALKQAIVEGELEDGTPLRQDEIAKMFNTSRIPVREAILKLEEHGLVTSKRYKGAVVSSLTQDEVREIFDFRALLESNVIAKAVPKMDDQVLRKARGYYEALATSTDPSEWGDLNRKFHETHYAASGLTYHLAEIDNALNRIDRYLRARILMDNGVVRADSDHQEIQEACEAGDANRAAELTFRHIEKAREKLLAFLD